MMLNPLIARCVFAACTADVPAAGSTVGRDFDTIHIRLETPIPESRNSGLRKSNRICLYATTVPCRMIRAAKPGERTKKKGRQCATPCRDSLSVRLRLLDNECFDDGEQRLEQVVAPHKVVHCGERVDFAYSVCVYQQVIGVLRVSDDFHVCGF